MDCVEIVTADGVCLQASHFGLAQPRAAIIVSPATATPRGYYHAFCEVLSERGAAALTYDYRGTVDSPDALRRSPARMRDWGELDFSAVVSWVSQRYPGVPIRAVGHSVGGHVLLMTPQNAHIERAVNVGSQSGYWKLYRGFEKYRVYAFMRVLMPLLTRLYGYFPGKRFVFGTDLAAGILYEWSRWCRSPQYFLADPSMATLLTNAKTLRADVTMIGLRDDPWATPAAIDAIVPAFTDARITRVEIDPAAYGLRAVGHMGFFRRAHADTLWPLALQALALDQPVPA